MKVLLFLLAALIAPGLYAQSFEGEIVYQVNYTSKMQDVSNERITNAFSLANGTALTYQSTRKPRPSGTNANDPVTVCTWKSKPNGVRNTCGGVKANTSGYIVQYAPAAKTRNEPPAVNHPATESTTSQAQSRQVAGSRRIAPSRTGHPASGAGR